MKKLNKILSVILAILMVISIIPITASAEAPTLGACGDNVIWNYDSTTYTLTISGTGEMYGYNSDNRPWEEHITFIQKVVINDGVTSIGRNAFYNCDSLESVDIPDSVTSIEICAFCASDGLKSIEIPGSVSIISQSAFSACKGLEEVILNEGVKTIEEGAFQNCSNLAQIEFPSTIEGIGRYAFRKSGLTSVTIPASAMSFGIQVFAECPNLTDATFSDGATFIGREVFSKCTALKNVYIPSSVTIARINTNAFDGCTALENVYFDGTLEEWLKITFVDVKAQPLYYAKNLYFKNELVTEVVVPETIKIINDFAFYNCDQLTSVKIPGSVHKINWCAFSNCSGLKNLTIEEGVSTFDKFSFYNCDALTSVTIPGSLKNMGNNVFDDCDALTKVVFADGCTSTGTKTFNSCDALKEVVLPTSMRTIGDNAFSNCISLEEISIPANVTSMGFKPFALCESLTNITVDDENQQFSSEDGVMFNKDKTSLIYYPIGKPETSYKIPEGVTTLQKYAFNNSSLKSVMIPTSMSQIYGYAFYECNEFTDIYYSGTKTQWDAITKDDNYEEFLGEAILHCEYEFGDYKYTVISETDKTIRIVKYNLYDFATNLVIPSTIDGYTVTEIGPSAFEGRTQFTNIVIPDSVIKIDERAFYQCTGLKKIAIPESVTEISANAFYGCYNLSKVLFNSDIKTIGVGAFNKCTRLADVYYTGTAVEWDSVTIGADNDPLINATKHFEYTDDYVSDSGTCGDNLTWTFNAFIGKLTISGTGDMYDYTSSNGAPWKVYGSTIENIVICEGVTSIGKYAFHNCTTFSSISMADSVTTIGSYAFYNCNGLTDIVIGKGVKELKRYTFYCCSSLETITFDKNVKSIHQYVVGSCSNLTDVYYLGSRDDWGNTSIGYNCFWPGEIHILGEDTHECSKEYIYDSVVTAPTCTEKGYTTYFCRCGKTRIDDYVVIDANNHSYTSKITTPATHLADGVETFTCACGDSYTEVIAKIEKHNYESVVTSPTCTEQGYTTYTCECGDSYVGDYVDSLGHSHTSEITTQATHLTTGIMTYTCACGDTYTSVIEKLEKHNYETVITEPTCAEQGYTTYTCECGDTYVDDYVDATGHNYSSEITTPATHTATGIMTYTCACGDAYTEVIEKLEEHNYESVVTAPTCTEQGYTTYTCECGDSYVDDYVDALGHTEETIPAVAPTCTETGLTEGAKCSVCGEILTEQKELSANGHTPTNAIEENYVLPTCTENGSKDVVIYCSVCDEEISRETVVFEATGHADNDGDGYCDECDALLDPSVECDHNCHKGGISGFFWKIANFFNKLFRTKQHCECGVAHY